ncbi:MAG: CPBP family intramembrane glutamic endopeptidase [Algisphaera sp.]
MPPSRPQQPKRRGDKSPRHAVTSYWDRTLWPIQSLYFLLPLVIGYELGTLWLAPAGGERLPPIYAESMLGRFFDWFGATGYYLPALAAVVVLGCQHVVSRDPWRPEPPLYLAMALESLVLAAPLFVFSLVMSRSTPAWSLASMATELPLSNGFMAAATHGAGLEAVPSWSAGVVFSVGAGIYEELVFRLVAIALLHLFFDDFLALPKNWSAGLSIALSAVAFALYHPFDTYVFWQWSNADWGRFTFYTLAGLYFAAIYQFRGFGIVAVTHALYDVMVITAHFRG